MIFFLIRHPQTEWHLEKRLQGHLDSPLTESGKETAIKLGTNLINQNITRIFSSDLGRCVQTAKIVADIIHVQIESTAELRERNFGKLNGENLEYARKNIDFNNPNFIFPEGESFNQMKTRVISFIKKISNNFKNETVLLVTHDGCTQALLSQSYKCDFNSTKCASDKRSIYKFLVEKNDFQLVEIIK